MSALERLKQADRRRRGRLAAAARPFAAAEAVVSGAHDDPEAPEAEPIYLEVTLGELRELRQALALEPKA